MAKYIDADKLKAHYAWWGDNSSERTLFDAIIDVQPAADVVKRKKGKWEKIPPYNQSYWKCSCCGKENKYAYKDGDVTIYELQDFFCPNCGAKMTEE